MVARPRDVPGCGNICEICLRYPSVPVVLKDTGGRCCVLVLTEGPLIDDGIVSGIVKKARGDPWLTMSLEFPKPVHKALADSAAHLEDEPPSQVDTADGL